MLGSKTPVSILQEMCLRKGNPPHYELIHDGGGSHEALFKYQVSVGEISAIGSGRSKKEAKHDAAKTILKRLKELGRSSTPEPSCLIIDEEIDEDVTSPYKDKLLDNAVGGLQELCMLNEIQVPEYKLVRNEGPPHAKLFTIACQVLQLEECAVARTKKQAKQQAAHKMLNRLKASLSTLTLNIEKGESSSEKKDDGDSNSEHAVNKYKELGTLSSNNRKIPIGQKIADYHLLLRSLESETLNKLKAEEKGITSEVSENPMEVLNRILEELSLEADYNGVASTADTSVVLLSISTVPESVVFGMADTEEEAQIMAAKNAIYHLKLMNM